MNLDPGAETMELLVDFFEPPFRGSASISRNRGGIQVRVTVTSDQPADTYYGVIRAADGNVVGRLTVDIIALP